MTHGTPSESLPLAAARKLEGLDELDQVADRIRPVVTDRLDSWPRLAELLHGRPLGHAAHPLLTDLPLGAWIGATTLDLVGGAKAQDSADRLLGIGILLAVPTSVTGLADWARSDRRTRRVGSVHAALNNVALMLYGTSWLLRRREHRAAGLGASLLAGVVVTVSGYLGGHMTLRLGAPPRRLSGPSRESS